MTMASQQGITRELGIGEVVSKTLELYQREFMKYFILFLIVEAIYGLVLTAVQHAIQQVAAAPALPANPTMQQVTNWLGTYIGPALATGAATLLIALVFYPVIYGSAVKMASDQIKSGHVDIETAVRFGASKLIWMWILGLVVGIIVFIGFVALIIPGIILSIMFVLVLPVLLIENTGVLGTMNRSRELVGHRWLKTFGTFLVFVIVIGIAAAIAGAISRPFGFASTEVSSILSALYLPIVPIALTVYYYSNLARIAPVPAGQAPMAQATVIQEGMKFCPNCGTKLLPSATFCSNCGAKQPA